MNLPVYCNSDTDTGFASMCSYCEGPVENDACVVTNGSTFAIAHSHCHFEDLNGGEDDE